MNLGGLLHGIAQALGNAEHTVAHAFQQPPTSKPAIPAVSFQSSPYYQSAAKDYQYTPAFQALAGNVNNGLGRVVGVRGAPQDEILGQFHPGANSIALNNNLANYSGSPDYTATHELLHAAYGKQTPQQQQQFLGLAQKSATPLERRFLAEQLSGPAYQYGGAMNDLSKLPPSMATEVHSYLPMAAAYTRTPLSPGLQQYYGQYFNPSASTQINQYYGDAEKANQIYQMLYGGR